MKKSLQYEPFDDIHSPIDARLGMQYIQGRNVVYGRKEGFIKGCLRFHEIRGNVSKSGHRTNI